MLGNFSYKNATKLYFGDDSLKYLNDELPKYGNRRSRQQKRFFRCRYL